MDFNSTEQHIHHDDNNNNIGMKKPEVFQDVDDDVVLDVVAKEKQGTYMTYRFRSEQHACIDLDMRNVILLHQLYDTKTYMKNMHDFLTNHVSVSMFQTFWLRNCFHKKHELLILNIIWF